MNLSRTERRSGLAVIPVFLTVTYPYWSPLTSASLWTALVPQLVSYLCLAVWCAANDRCGSRLFIVGRGLRASLLSGAVTGFLTGLINFWVIVKLTPWLGYSYEFLRNTPHARMPFGAMVPWGITAIAFLVEVNFRGFILGRFEAIWGEKSYGPSLAVILSALVFSWDPFMVTVFRGYHWLALTDGLIWGALLLWTRNLFSTISAHALEVILVYSVLRLFYA